MRCQECLAVVEEFYDGELDPQTSRRVDAHVAACQDCAAAFDALGFEQELYLRYERDVEVSPALWQGVRAGLARLDEAEKVARPLTPLTWLRERLGGALSALAMRPALASSLALLLVAAAVGALWLGRMKPDTKGHELASNSASEPAPEPGVVNPPNIDKQTNVADSAGGRTDEILKVEGGAGAAVRAPEGRGTQGELRFLNAGNTNAAAPTRRAPAGDTVAPPPTDHLNAAESELLASSRPVALAFGDVAGEHERLLAPEEKEVARHVEQAQMLLRSFDNAGEAERGAANVAYERQLSRKLLDENSTLQMSAESAGDKGTKQVLDTLEPFLLDIANLRDQPSREEVRSIKERMRKTEIIAALHVY